MKKEKLSKRVQLYSLLMISSILLFTIALAFFMLHNRFVEDSKQVRSRYMETKKKMIKKEVLDAVINFEDSFGKVEVVIREVVKQRIEEVYAVITSIYENNRDKSNDEIVDLINMAIRPLRFLGDQGYFFMTRYDGVELLFADKPELEGKNLLGMRDVNGKEVVKDMIKLAKEFGEGFYDYHWTMPDKEGESYSKISFIKAFKPLNLFVGTGLYVEDMQTRIKEQLLNDFRDIRFGEFNKGYLFAADWSGNVITGPGKGKNLINIKNEKGVMVVQEMIRIAKDGGGFFQYLMPIDDKKNKLSFVKSPKGQKFYIGTGVYIDAVELEISLLRKARNRAFKIRIFSLGVVALLAFAVLYFLNRLVGKAFDNDISSFVNLFQKATEDNHLIDAKQIRFSEIDKLVININMIIQDRLTAQDDLLAEKEYLAVTLRSIGDGVITTDCLGRVVVLNKIGEHLTGWQQDEAISKSLFEIFKIGNDSFFNVLERVIMDDKIVCLDRGSVLTSKDGVHYSLDSSASPIHDKYNKVIGMMIIFRDITDILAKERDAQELMAKLSQSRKMDAIGQLASGIAHDFNNMLGGIIGAANLMKSPKRGLDDKNLQFVDMIIKAAKRAAGLTAQLLTFSRKHDDSFDIVDMNIIIDDAVNLLSKTIDKNIELVNEKSAKQSKISGNATELQNLLINLGINSSHAMPNGGSFKIKSENVSFKEDDPTALQFGLTTGEYLKLEVLDTGSGISPSNLKKVFNPFFTTKEQGKGTGLGLSTAYGAVKNHKGAITVYSELGVGTRFVIYFPILYDGTIIDSNNNPDESITGVGKILLIDDEEVIRITAKEQLEELGYEVVLAENGEEGFEMYKKNYQEISLVITDMIMPKMSGKELFYKIKTINKKCEVILSSGFSKAEDVAQLKEDGLGGFITKPFDKIELSKIVSETILNANI